MTPKPYDEYVDRAVLPLEPSATTCSYVTGRIVREDHHFTLDERTLRRMLADAWLAGLAYSLDLIEEETKSPLRVRLRDMPKKFDGGDKMLEPFTWEKCR